MRHDDDDGDEGEGEGESEIFEEAFEQVVELGNELADAEDDDTDAWEVASGLLAGAVQFWLYAHQPCDEPDCEACAEVATAKLRLDMLLAEVRELAESSEYFHSPNDIDVGRA